MNIARIVPATLAVLGIAAAIWAPSPVLAQSNRDVVNKSKSMVPSPPWAKGDQVGMANTLGPGTWMRCAAHLTNPKSKTYEVSHIRSNTMPASPFGVSPRRGVGRALRSWGGVPHVSIRDTRNPRVTTRRGGVRRLEGEGRIAGWTEES